MSYDTDPEYRQKCDELHQRAYEAGELTYIDPKTRLKVFTRLFMEQRGFCCESGCRHCPWNYRNRRK